MTAALVGLIGVVIGALLTGGWQLLLRRRDERQELRAIARLASEDLDVRVRGLHGTRSAYRGIELSLARHQMLFAQRLPRADWEVLASALTDWDVEQSYVLRHADPDEWMKRNANLANSLEQAQEVLRHYC